MAPSAHEPFSEAEAEVIFEQREVIKNIEKAAFDKLPSLPDDFEEFWINVPLSDTWISQGLVVRPKPLTVKELNNLGRQGALRTYKSRPLFIYFHAGGFAAGSPAQVLLPARRFAIDFDATVLCPAYRLMPEHAWPQSAKDGMDFVQLVSSNQNLQYGANLADGFILAGASAGGCIASVITALVSANPKEYPLQYPLTGLYVTCPLLLVESIVPAEYKSMYTSPVENMEQSGLESLSVNSVLTKLKPHEYSSPWFSPINPLAEAAGHLGGLDESDTRIDVARNHPPTFVQANLLDPLRDDALIYEKLLVKLGVTTKLQAFPDDAHLSFSTWTLLIPGKSHDPTLEEGTMEGIAWLLKRDWPPKQTMTEHEQDLPLSLVSELLITQRALSENSQSNSGSSLYPHSLDTSP